MRRLLKNTITLTIILLANFAYTQDTLTVMAYNILNYPISNSTKADTLKHIINYVKPDIFMVTELTSASGANTILSSALNINGISFYQKSNFVNGPDTDNLIYYNGNKLTLFSQQEIPTVLRNISEYVLLLNSSIPSLDTVFVYCYVAHLKAQSGSANENQRNQEATTLKNFMDTRINIENVFLGGDFNLYSSSEPAHNTILNTGNVSLFDPISTPGNWSENSSFANVHTQSTRQWFIGDGGAFGGVDDRFDWIYVTGDVLNGSNGLTYVPNSYKALGNDGNHYNKSINASPTNSAVPSGVADALYYFSDHLPIVMKVTLASASCTSTTGTDIQTACNSYTWIDGNIYNSSNTSATHILTNSAGCDSVVTLDLTINTADDITLIETTCDASNVGSVVQNLTNQAGCDSTVTTNTTLVTIDTSTTASNATIMANQIGATYQWMDCTDSTPITGATNQSYTAVANGNFSVLISLSGCSETSSCITISTVTINENTFGAEIVLFPNPTTDLITLKLGELSSIQVTITDLSGKVFYSNNQITNQMLSISMKDFATGSYLLEVLTGNERRVFNVVKK